MVYKFRLPNSNVLDDLLKDALVVFARDYEDLENEVRKLKDENAELRNRIDELDNMVASRDLEIQSCRLVR